MKKAASGQHADRQEAAHVTFLFPPNFHLRKTDTLTMCQHAYVTCEQRRQLGVVSLGWAKENKLE